MIQRATSPIISSPSRRRSTSAAPIERMPRHVDPMLATLSDLPGDPANYNFEFKWDGVRALCFYDGARIRLESRNQLEITPRYPELHALGEALGKRTAILDGEVVAMDASGAPSFPMLQKRMHVRD